MTINLTAAVTDRIEELERLGFKRWKKNGMDRMYADAEVLGLYCEYYNTGNISYAEFNGEKISNTQAREIKSAKTYIDLIKHKLVSDRTSLAKAAALLIGVEYIVDAQAIGLTN